MAYAAGAVLTAAEMNSWLPVVAIKTAATTRVSTTTLAADPDLSVTLLAGCRYRVQVNLGVSGAAAADVQIGYARTGTVSQVSSATAREFVGPDTTTTNVSTGASMSVQKSSTSQPDTARTYGTTTTAGTIREEFWVDGGVSGGTLTLQWAQGVSDPGNTTLTGAIVAQRIA